MKITKSLAFLLAGIVVVDPECDCDIHGLSVDSRQIKPGDLFIAYPGEHVDGRNFIQQAIKAGAAAVLAEIDDNNDNMSIIMLKAHDIQQHIGQIAARFYDHPSRRMSLIGVTGTNGKTSIAYLLALAMNKLEDSCMNTSIYLGTLGIGFPERLQESTHTTLDPIHLQQCLANFHKKGVTHAMLEVSSHALDQGRVAHVEFDTAVFTNLTRDHLDYHKTMAAYGEAKAKLFKQFGLKSAVMNWDDPFGLQLYHSLSAAIFKIGYSLLHEDADIYADNIVVSAQGMQANIKTPWGEGLLKTPLMGRFNLYNILAAVGVLGLSYSLDKILTCIQTLPHVPGRMECVGMAPLCLVDYAHTPDALLNVLTTAKALIHEGQLWCVFGCGGDRDKGKRPEMGKIAAQWADHVIVTNDNPRTENPEQIAQAIVSGMPDGQAVNIILDREKAIIYALHHANKNDIIVIAGKGHERYQIIGTKKHIFSDQAICAQVFN